MQGKCFIITMPLLVILIGICAINDKHANVGIIANGAERVEANNFSRHSQTVQVVKRFTDTSEVFNIFRSVRDMDKDVSIDVIVLIDYDSSVLEIPNIMTTHNKRLLTMGANPKYQQNVYINYTDGFGNMKSSIGNNAYSSDKETYCLKSSNGTIIHRDTLLLRQPVPRAVCSVVRSLKWKYVIIFYESATEDEITKLVDGFSTDGVLFALFNIDTVKDLHSVLLNIYRTSITNNKEISFIIVCGLRCTKDVLKAANEFDSLNKFKTLMKKFSKWLIALHGHTRYASQELATNANDLDNVGIIAIPEYKGSVIEDIFYIIEKTLLDTLREQIIIDSTEAFKNDFIDKFGENVQSWDPTSKCQSYFVDTLLWSNNGRAFSTVGHIDINGDVFVNSDIFPNLKYGYNKRKFRVSTLEYAPFVIKRKVNDTYIYEGFCMDLLDELAHKLNFTYELTEPADGNWGTITSKENLTFNGLVGQLQREEIDFVAAPIASQAIRSPAMDFSYSYYYEYTTVLVKKPDVNSRKWRTLIDPLKWEVLLTIGMCLLSATVLVYLMEKYNPFYDTPEHAEERMIYGGLHELHSSFWYVFGALLCQGGVHLPQSTSGRTLISCWWLTCIIIVGTYCGNLIAFLTVTKEKPPFNTLSEMLELKGTYKWGTVGGTSWEMAFPTSSNPTFRAIGKAFQEFSKTDSTVLHQRPPFHINRVKEDEKYAWIGDKTSIEIAMATECSLVSIKENFMPLIYVFGFTNDSPHTHVFSEQMIKIHEGGLYQIWKRKWWPKSNFCAGSSIPEAKPISFMDVQSAFYVCLIGIFIGLFAFLIEILFHKYRVYLKKRNLCESNCGIIRDNNQRDLNGSKCSARL